MQLFTWLSKWITSGTQTQRAPARKPTSRFRPQLESLEGRDMPSTLTVTSAADSGAGSLRADIAAANPGDTINFAPSLNGQAIQLASGQLLINKSLTIQGPGAGELAISGGNSSRVFEVVSSNTNVLLSGLTITQGNGAGGGPDGDGGGILNLGGSTLTISGCTLSNNRALSGGGVYNSQATLQMVDCTLSGNRATENFGTSGGGGVYIVNSRTGSTVTGCTFSHNTASSEGGGIYVGRTTMTISGCTFSNNTASSEGGGIYLISATLTIEGCSFSDDLEGSYPTYAGNDIYSYSGDTASMLTVSDSVFSNNTPYRFVPIIGRWTNGGGNTFNSN
jgi:parallel beta-helix repeat protein